MLALTVGVQPFNDARHHAIETLSSTRRQLSASETNAVKKMRQSLQLPEHIRREPTQGAAEFELGETRRPYYLTPRQRFQ